MPKDLPKDALETADAAVAFAQQVRKFHRRRTNRRAQQRVEDIERALERLKEAMVPIKSQIGRFPYDAQTTAAEERREAIKEQSKAIQRERRKLWKMRTKEEK